MGFINDPEDDNFQSSFGTRDNPIGDDVRTRKDGSGANRAAVMNRQMQADHLGAHGRKYREWHSWLMTSSSNLSSTGINADAHFYSDTEVRNVGDRVAAMSTVGLILGLAYNDNGPEHDEAVA